MQSRRRKENYAASPNKNIMDFTARPAVCAYERKSFADQSEARDENEAVERNFPEEAYMMQIEKSRA